MTVGGNLEAFFCIEIEGGFDAAGAEMTEKKSQHQSFVILAPPADHVLWGGEPPGDDLEAWVRRFICDKYRRGKEQ